MGTVGLYAKDRILICAYFVWYIERQLVREMPAGLGMVPGVNETEFMERANETALIKISKRNGINGMSE